MKKETIGLTVVQRIQQQNNRVASSLGYAPYSYSFRVERSMRSASGSILRKRLSFELRFRRAAWFNLGTIPFHFHQKNLTFQEWEHIVSVVLSLWLHDPIWKTEATLAGSEEFIRFLYDKGFMPGTVARLIFQNIKPI